MYKRQVPDIRDFILEHHNELDSIELVTRGKAERDRLWQVLEQRFPDLYITSSFFHLLELSSPHSCLLYTSTPFLLCCPFLCPRAVNKKGQHEPISCCPDGRRFCPFVTYTVVLHITRQQVTFFQL